LTEIPHYLGGKRRNRPIGTASLADRRRAGRRKGSPRLRLSAAAPLRRSAYNLADMVADPAEPSSSGRPGACGGTDAAASPSGGQGPPRERYGPVEVTRLVKDDGRALILYTRADGPR